MHESIDLTEQQTTHNSQTEHWRTDTLQMLTYQANYQ